MRKEITVGVATAIGTTLVLYIAGKITQFPTVLVPSSAVVAFRAASCPDGWKEVEFTKGRFIIGVGETDDLTTRNLLDKGGEETHRLTEGEMPSHSHTWKGVRADRQDDYGFGGSEKNVHRAGQNYDITDIGQATGGDQAHNNMPPFVALLFCEKE